MAEKHTDPGQAEVDEALTGVEEASSGTEKQDVEAAQPPAKATDPAWDWNTDPANPYNWSTGKKWNQVLWLSWFALSSTIGTSIISPAHEQLMAEFGVTSTQAILPLSLYVFALALGPVVGGPLSEMAGRYWVYMISNPIGMLFTLGAGFTHSFAGLCILRFLAGFAFAPSLAIASGTITESFKPAERGLASTVFVLMPFLGSGVGPVIGAFVSDRKDWRWTQWTIIFFVLFSEILAAVIGYETFHPILRRRQEKELGRPVEPKAPLSDTIKKFVFVALLRPLAMLFTEPIIALICLYVGCEFATLFSFFAAVPYVFTTVYGFTTEQNGLVFIAVGVGCVLATITVILCNIFFYLKQVPKFPPHKVPPEYRLFPAMIGSIGLPVGLFWFAWTAREDVSWVSPVIAMIPFAWGNLCVFISTFQFIVDCYSPAVVASAASANSLARYVFGGAFPLFAIQMYQNLGVNWAASLFGFISIALMPVPWAFYRFGPRIRATSRYETATY